MLGAGAAQVGRDLGGRGRAADRDDQPGTIAELNDAGVRSDPGRTGGLAEDTEQRVDRRRSRRGCQLVHEPGWPTRPRINLYRPKARRRAQ
jgi:hypothetical protein